MLISSYMCCGLTGGILLKWVQSTTHNMKTAFYTTLTYTDSTIGGRSYKYQRTYVVLYWHDGPSIHGIYHVRDLTTFMVDGLVEDD